MAIVPQPIASFSKDPTSVLDYSIDWSDFLGDDSISSSSWSLDAGIGNAGSMFCRNLSTIFLSGGSNGVGYNARNTIVTAGSRTETRTIKINVVNR